MGDDRDGWVLGGETPPQDAPPPAQGPAWTPMQGAAWTPPPPFVPVIRDPADEAATYVPHVFHHARRLALIACSLLGLAGGLAAVRGIQFIMGVELQGRLNIGQGTIPETQSYNDSMYGLAWAAIAVSLIGGIAFMRWLWRSVGNATELDAGIGVSSPRGAVVAWIIPIYSLFRPFQIVIDLHDRLLAPLASQTGRWLIRAWWTLWILGTIVGYALLLASHPTNGSDNVMKLVLMAGSCALTAADAILAIAVIRQLQRLADARETARAGDPSRAIELVAASQRPRVTRWPVALAGAAVLALVIPLGVAFSTANRSIDWPTYSSPDGSFSVSFPTTPVETPISQTDSGMTITGKSLSSGISADRRFELDYLDFPVSLSTVPTSQLFDLFEGGLGSNVVIESRSDITIDGRPGRELHGAATVPSTTGGTVQVKYRLWVCIDGDRVFLLEADAAPGQADSPDIDRFLNSFKLN